RNANTEKERASTPIAACGYALANARLRAAGCHRGGHSLAAAPRGLLRSARHAPSRDVVADRGRADPDSLDGGVLARAEPAPARGEPSSRGVAALSWREATQPQVRPRRRGGDDDRLRGLLLRHGGALASRVASGPPRRSHRH